MRLLALLLASCGVVAVACSEAEPQASPCIIPGTYTTEVQPLTEPCVLDADAGAGPVSGPPVVTISSNEDPARPYLVHLQGFAGPGCPAEVLGVCKVQARCQVLIVDALDPQNNVGTIQMSWEFDQTRFRGLVTSSTPPARSVPSGCLARADMLGTRQ